MMRYAITYDNPARRAAPGTNDTVCSELLGLGGTVSFPLAGPETTVGFEADDDAPTAVAAAIVRGLDRDKGSAMVSYRQGDRLSAFTWPPADTPAARLGADWKRLI
jgi:hypothetical protein